MYKKEIILLYIFMAFSFSAGIFTAAAYLLSHMGGFGKNHAFRPCSPGFLYLGPYVSVLSWV